MVRRDLVAQDGCVGGLAEHAARPVAKWGTAGGFVPISSYSTLLSCAPASIWTPSPVFPEIVFTNPKSPMKLPVEDPVISTPLALGRAAVPPGLSPMISSTISVLVESVSVMPVAALPLIVFALTKAPGTLLSSIPSWFAAAAPGEAPLTPIRFDTIPSKVVPAPEASIPATPLSPMMLGDPDVPIVTLLDDRTWMPLWSFGIDVFCVFNPMWLPRCLPNRRRSRGFR